MVSQDERSTRTREKLIRHAALLFARSGYDGTSLDSIASSAKVNKALVKYHFRNKQGLYTAVLLTAIRAAADKLEPARDTTLSPSVRLRRYIECLAHAFREAPEFPFIVLREEMSGGHRLEDDVMKEFVGFFKLDREILLAGVASGAFRKLDPHEAHLSLVGSLAFFLASQPLRQARKNRRQLPRSPAFSSYVKHITDLFLRGLENR